MNTQYDDARSSYNCYCQKTNGATISSNNHDESSSWKTCRIRGEQVVATPATPDTPATPGNFPDGCTSEWVETNAYGSGERGIGSVESRAQCVEKVKAECPEFDLANTQGSDSTSCWCQKSHGATTLEAQSSSYVTCKVK